MAEGRRFVISAGAVVAMFASGAMIADAATLGGVNSAVLSAFSATGSSGAPSVTAWEDFERSNRTRLDGQITDGGGLTWVAVRGNWRIRQNRANATRGDVALVVDAGTPDQSAEATLFRGGTTFDFGLVANMNADGSEFIAAELSSASNGQVELWRFDGAWTLLVAVGNLYTGAASGWPTSTTMRLESTSGGQMRVSLDGSLLIDHTLGPADQSRFKNADHQWFGLHSYYDGASQWDDFHIDA